VGSLDDLNNEVLNKYENNFKNINLIYIFFTCIFCILILFQIQIIYRKNLIKHIMMSGEL
jgi:uncharacterized membrane protein YesL